MTAADVNMVLTHYEGLDTLIKELPHSRHRALALTALEESGLWLTEALLASENARGLGNVRLAPTKQKENA
jgi:hypothetical protein